MSIPSELKSSLRPLTTSAFEDLSNGLMNWSLWARMGWLEVKRRYRRTVIGPFWSAVSLAIMVGAVGAIGSALWKQDPFEYLPFLASGLVVWMLISSITIESCGLFVNSSTLFRQMRFDYSILVYSLVWRNFIVFLHNLTVYVVILVLMAPQQINFNILLVAPGMLALLINGVWIALLLGLICLRFRDILQLINSLIQIAMFVTPIFWPLNALENSARVVFVHFNPLYHLITIVRDPLIGKIPPSEVYLAVAVITVCGWALTYVVFERFRKRIVYWS